MIAAPFLACAVQLTSTPDFGDTLARAATLVAEAAAAGATLVGLPENFSQICETQEETAAQAPSTYPVVLSWLSVQARRHGITIYGSAFAPAGHRVRNRLLVVDPTGAVIAHYDKRHLFDVALGGQDTVRESDDVEAGTVATVADLGPCGKLGLSICYDLRFPEHFRALVDQGAEILTVPAAFVRTTGRDHWQVLLQARAIENQCYVIAPAQTGEHNVNRRTYGHAMIIDPWGTVLADAGDDEGLVLAQIEPIRLADVRRKLPALANRRSL
ncbi:MAG: carbon-nitrogen hydrolase family protein [Candidatus Sericytochromatia bacterium]|nr:carbon-nitrogen hydrolase family protein [Candidatus Sericytochromatia bacterium]